jgi:phosphohistidine phosphatase
MNHSRRRERRLSRHIYTELTMKTLYILRHAKSSWSDPDLADFDRPLNDRGNAAAPFMGRLMSESGFLPDIILASPAERAKQTAMLVKDAGDLRAEIKFDERIYEASPQTLRQVISGLEQAISSAMLVGHNPGMEGFIRYLTKAAQPMPTAALAIVDLPVDNWRSVDPGSGILTRIIRPKEEMRSRGIATG